MFIVDQGTVDFWNLFTRLGEAQILLPAALLAGFALIRRPDARPLAMWWLVLLCAATFVTTASKIAFIGWGVGSSEFNFTGVSGHAMFAAAIYPLLLGTLASHAPRAGRNLAIAAGCGLALMVGVSRVVVGAHSVSEVVAGLLLGGGVSALALAMVVLPRSLVGPMIPIAVGVWFAVMPIRAPASQTHSMVTELSLKLSGRSAPYTRSDMLRGASVRQSKLSGWLAYELPLIDRQASVD